MDPPVRNFNESKSLHPDTNHPFTPMKPSKINKRNPTKQITLFVTSSRYQFTSHCWSLLSAAQDLPLSSFISSRLS